MKDKFNLEKLDPCEDALEYVKSKANYVDAWNDCDRGDWMLWIATKLKVDHRKLTLAKGLCANTVRHLMEDERSIKSVDVAVSYGKGEATKEDLKNAAYAAYAAYAASAAYFSAAYAAYVASAAYAASAASAAYFSAASAAYSAASAASTTYATPASSAAFYTAAAAAAAAYAYAYTANAAKKENQKQTADICREILSDEVLKVIKCQ